MRQIAMIIVAAVMLTACQTVDDTYSSLASSLSSAKSKLFGSPSAPTAPTSPAAATPPQTPSTPFSFSQANLPPEAVIDGTTIKVLGSNVTLFGIAPTSSGAVCAGVGSCSQIAREALIGFVTGTTVRCVTIDPKRPAMGQCFADNTDLSTLLVRAGLATADTNYSSLYVSAQDSAKNLKYGLWKTAPAPTPASSSRGSI